MFGHTVVVAYDRASAKVRARAEAGVADIGEMVGLGAVLDHGFFDLHKIADVYISAKTCARPQPIKLADAGDDACRRRGLRWT